LYQKFKMTLIIHNKDGKFLTDEIKNQFIELVFKKHPNATFIYMVKRDVGMVFSEPDVYTKSYCLTCGSKGFELMEIDPPSLLASSLDRSVKK
jgi:hypothetical protein